MSVKHANNASMLLVGSHPAGSTTLTVDDASELPALTAGIDWMYLVVDLEVVKISDVTGVVLTLADSAVTQGSHGDGAPVVLKTTSELLTDLSTGLELVTEGGFSGYRFVGRPKANHLDIGLYAVDLTYTFPGIGGASGSYSIAGGNGAVASGNGAIALGPGTISSGTGSFACNAAQASGYQSFAGGSSTTHAKQMYSFAFGLGCNNDAIGAVTFGNTTHAINQYSFNAGKFNKGIDVNTICEIGIGTSAVDKKNGFEVHITGEVKAPSATPELIRSADDGTLITKEYMDSTFLNTQLNLYVDESGNDANDGTELYPFATVRQAVIESKKYWINRTGTIRINVAAGDIYENDYLSINHPQSDKITIYGAGKANTRVHLAGTDSISIYDAYIGNLELRGDGSGTANSKAIYCYNNSYCKIESVSFIGFETCVKVDFGSRALVRSTNMSDFKFGVICDNQSHAQWEWTGSVVGNSAAGSICGKAAHGSTMLVTGNVTGAFSGAAIGFLADINSFIDVNQIVSNTCTVPYSPAATTVEAAEPTWGNWGSWIRFANEVD